MLGQTTDSAGAARRVDGRVVRGHADGAAPARWTMGRAAPRRSRSLGAARLRAHGRRTARFSFRYRASGDTRGDLLRDDGVRRHRVSHVALSRALSSSGDDAMITVFDTTSRPGPDQDRRPTSDHWRAERERAAAGRRSVRSRRTTAPSPRSRRTASRRSGRRTFRRRRSLFRSTRAASLPPARCLATEPRSDCSRRSVRAFASSRSPTSCRRARFRFAFPLERPTGVLEVLVQEPTARVQAPALREVPPESAEGRVFRRFLAQDVPANVVLEHRRSRSASRRSEPRCTSALAASCCSR